MSINYSEEQFDEMITSSALLKEDANELSLRPRTLSEYIGQQKAKENLDVSVPPNCARNRWIMSFSTALRDWEKLHLQPS